MQQNHWFKNYSYITLGLVDLSSITIILPPEAQTLLNPYSALASSLKIYFIHGNLFSNVVPDNLIIAQLFFCAVFLLPIWCARSISDNRLCSQRWSLIMPINKASVFSLRCSSTPCIRRQFHLVYCSCSSTCTARLLTLSVNSMTCTWVFTISSSLAFLLFSYSSNMTDISWTESLKSDNCSSTLIWNVVVSLEESDISFILHTRFLTQLKKIATNLGEFKRKV